MRHNNPEAYGRELGRRAGRAKHDLLRRGDADVACFLHPNASALIDGLVDRGVKTVVLDECHHLLDYWAVVLRYLIGRIRDPRVVGLTATLPSPEDGNEYESYTTLLGEVDFEVPTPAVVKEGDLAPYRDLAYFTEPTQREMDYLNNVQRAFEAENSRFTRSEALQEWAARAMLGEEKDGKHLEEVLNARPVFSLAALRYLRHAGQAIPGDLLTMPLEANEPPTLEDWAALLERYALDHLQTSPARRITASWRSFGGRSGRSDSRSRSAACAPRAPPATWSSPSPIPRARPSAASSPPSWRPWARGFGPWSSRTSRACPAAQDRRRLSTATPAAPGASSSG